MQVSESVYMGFLENSQKYNRGVEFKKEGGVLFFLCGQLFKEIMRNRLTWGWPEVLSMAPIVQIL
jgi:hypothetical protein